MKMLRRILFIIDLDSIAKIKPIAQSRRHFAYKKWNYNLFMTYSNGNVNFFINNQKILELTDVPKPDLNEKTLVEMAAYLDNEPMMDMPNLVRYFALYDKMPTENDMTSSNSLFTSMIDKGILHPTKFHFNAGPYLNYVTKTSVNLLWETDRQADFLIEYGETSDFGNRVEVRNLDIKEEPAIDGLINEIKIDNLKQNTPYFYKITAMSADGEMIDSGVLTFQTAVSDSSPYTFAVIGDTEARFHINDMISKGIWRERPNFMMIAGDLTDGGMEHHKFEWNYEYFQGMGQVISRIPVFPILGNGEGDVFWYDRYQSLPGTGENYTFKYGNAEFFLMNSNRKEDFAPGMPIYNWLKEQLENSTAKWKFAMFHHAPYSSDEDDYGDSWKGKSTLGDTKIRKITPLFDEFNVDMVFYGHLHAYERSHPIKADAFHEDGTVYVLVGGAGGNLEDFAPTKAWFNQKTHRGHHYVKVDINGGRLDYFMYTVEGNLVDYFTIKK
jgi:Icc-related predicted phosphoesterase